MIVFSVTTMKFLTSMFELAIFGTRSAFSRQTA
jgi:hypothetical protein